MTFIGPSIGKLMPESGLDFRICAEITRERVGRNEVRDDTDSFVRGPELDAYARLLQGLRFRIWGLGIGDQR